VQDTRPALRTGEPAQQGADFSKCHVPHIEQLQSRLPSGQQQNVVMAPTLGEALGLVFGGAVSRTPPSTGGGQGGPQSALVERLIARANTQYAAAQAALRAGDLTAFGREIEALGRTLARLEAVR
jgi:uncharacterized membrane protein (UPF0182 family)